jgi:DNA-binding transcriptional MocR family regulator
MSSDVATSLHPEQRPPMHGARDAMKLYERLADEMSDQIRAGVLRSGDRLPSVRSLTRSRSISPGTVLQAYALLESRGEIRTRPRSGFYVNPHWRGLPHAPAMSRPAVRPQVCKVSELVFEIFEAIKNPQVVALGSPFPSPELFPFAKLAQALHTGMRRLNPQDMVAHVTPANPHLRRQIARRYLESGLAVRPEDIVITSGALEALNLCLQTVARPGDLIAIESPAFYAVLEAIQRNGMRAVELPTSARDGIDLAALDAALQRHPIKACWIMPNFQNPLGSLMPEQKKRELVRMLAERDIPLIEDDVYSELYFGRDQPKPAKAFDRKGLVLHCSSFSKCVAPGYRVGWVAPGQYFKEVERAKLMTTIATSVPMQAALVEYLKHGGYEHHLRRLRRELQRQQDQMLQSLRRHFPGDIHVSKPQGGYFLWIEMQESVNALELHRRAMERNITTAPGPIFSPQRKFANCIRLNYGMPWTPRVEASVATLGGIIASLSGSAKPKSAMQVLAA